MKLINCIKLPVAILSDLLLISPIIHAVDGIVNDKTSLDESPWQTVKIVKAMKDAENKPKE